jgi:hypothetical protein
VVLIGESIWSTVRAFSRTAVSVWRKLHTPGIDFTQGPPDPKIESGTGERDHRLGRVVLPSRAGLAGARGAKLRLRVRR